MSKIILITAAHQQNGEPQTESLMDERPVDWCIKYLQLEEEPIPLTEKIELLEDPNDHGGTQHVFVKVVEGEAGIVKSGFYPSEKSPTEVRQLLRSHGKLT
jgi:hypothetical protein